MTLASTAWQRWPPHSLRGTLLDLDLCANAIGSTADSDEERAQALNAIGCATSLIHLYLGHNELGGEGVAALHHTLSSLPSLSHLDLSGNQFGSSADMYALLPALEVIAAASQLNVLDLAFNEMGDEAAAVVARLLVSQLTHLKQLTLVSSRLSPSSVLALRAAAQAVPVQASVREPSGS